MSYIESASPAGRIVQRLGPMIVPLIVGCAQFMQMLFPQFPILAEAMHFLVLLFQ